MALFHPITRSATTGISGAALALIVFTATPAAANVAVSETVGYISKTAQGGTVSSPGLSFVSPSLAHPVEWQGRVASVSGVTVTVDNGDWPTGRFGAFHALEVTSGNFAGTWTEIVAVSGNQITVADSLDGLLEAAEMVRIRRLTTLSDFLGENNETGLNASSSPSTADVVSVYHVTGMKNYWYYDGSQGGVGAGWYDSAWNSAGDAIIAPGEGVVIRRKTSSALLLRQAGAVRDGRQSVLVTTNRNFIGGVIPADIRLSESGLYTGSDTDGMASGDSPANADLLIIYGMPLRTYWYYDGAQGALPAGWYDSLWNSADDVAIPGGSTFVIERNQGDAFVWNLPPR